MPATALPTINAVLEGAAPHITEPSSKIPIAARKVPFTYTQIENASHGDGNDNLR
jgi:hypothetical protein